MFPTLIAVLAGLLATGLTVVAVWFGLNAALVVLLYLRPARRYRGGPMTLELDGIAAQKAPEERS
jgi:hypothetical protein